MSESLTYPGAGAPTRDQAHTLFAQTMGYVAATAGLFALGAYLGRHLGNGAGFVAFIAALACLIGMQFAARRSAQLTVGLLGAFGLLIGLGLAMTLAYYASANPQALWQAGGAMTGKVAVITGAFRGIGAGLVAAYRGRGWAVVASARAIKPPQDPYVLSIEGDIADPATAEMASRYGGHVVNITATLAEIADSGTPAALAALTKGGLAAATRSLAIEYAAYGIRVNAVSPGIIQTPVHPATKGPSARPDGPPAHAAPAPRPAPGGSR